MTQLEQELSRINLGLLDKSMFHFGENYVDIKLLGVSVSITKRPFYCDRGRYGFCVETQENDRLTIDWADGFPRYFFNLQRAIDEMNDWIEFRKIVAPV